MGKNNAKMVDLQLYKTAGIDPKTGLPLKVVESLGSKLKANVKRLLRIKDEQQAITRFKWTIPEKINITGEELERLLYYKGQLCFFYLEELDKYFFMPYALDGTIDFYGRFNRIHPVPMTSGKDDNEGGKKVKTPQEVLLENLKLDVIYKENEFKDQAKEAVCVLIHDYPKQIAQTIIPRSQIQDGILDFEAECLPYLRTSMIAHSGVRGMRVSDADQEQNVKVASRSTNTAALEGEVFVPIIGSIEFQELMDKGGQPLADYMEAFQSIDNFRLSLYGLDNGGVFEKKSHMLNSEQEMNQSTNSSVSDADLASRQKFCDIAKKIWGLDFKVEVVKQEAEEMGNEALQEENKLFAKTDNKSEGE